MRAEFERVLRYDPNHFYHDDLAETNSPVYFRDFMETASRHGLQYLAEADFFEMHAPPWPEAPDAPRLPGPENLIEYEQYLDFLRCRRFRQTLLCHGDVGLDRAPRPDGLMRLHLASQLRPASEAPDLGHGKVERFTGPKESEIETDFPAAKAALAILWEIWPSSLAFDELLLRARSRAAAGQTDGDDRPEQIARELAEMLLKLYAANMIELTASGARFTIEVSERPRPAGWCGRSLRAGEWL